MKKLNKALVGIVIIGILTGCSTGSKETEQVSEATTTVATEEVTTVTSETVGEATTVEETTTVETTMFDAPEINIEVTSPNLIDGVWDDKITNTLYGEYLSPELSWTEAEGANYYAVYMIDTQAYWLHMEVMTSDTALTLGQVDGSDDNKYIGPYPPSGTHPYNIYVVALKELPGKVTTHFDSSINKIDDFLKELDINQNGDSGNIVGYGILEGEYSYIEVVDETFPFAN